MSKYFYSLLCTVSSFSALLSPVAMAIIWPSTPPPPPAIGHIEFAPVAQQNPFWLAQATEGSGDDSTQQGNEESPPPEDPEPVVAPQYLYPISIDGTEHKVTFDQLKQIITRCRVWRPRGGKCPVGY